MKEIFTAFLLVFFLPAGAQESVGSISGTVATDSGAPLPYATVLIEGTKLGVLTDENGAFSFRHVPLGKHRIRISHIGFESHLQLIEISKGSTKVKTGFTLQQSEETLNEVTVRGKTSATELETEGFAVNVIDTKEASLRNIQTNELLNTTVGVKIRQNGGLGAEVNYMLNGLSGSAVRVFIDGIPISVYGNSFNLNSIPPAMIKQIEVYKGVVPGHLADDALGGAINIVLENTTQSNFNASVSYGSFNTLQSSVNGMYRFKNQGSRLTDPFFIITLTITTRFQVEVW